MTIFVQSAAGATLYRSATVAAALCLSAAAAAQERAADSSQLAKELANDLR